jgi:HAE1 family hydrophobic/amphiphilic exporter-1
MNVAQGSVNRPILTFVVFLIIMILGVVSLSRLSIDLMPEITYPTISVVTSYGNVGPEEMEELVTRPVEEALAAVQGVQELTSTSTEGTSVVRVAFDWGTDLDVAANDIRDRIDRVLGRLPEDIERPMIRKFDVSATPIMFLGVSSHMNPLDLRQLIEDQVKYRLERVPGVASVDVWGGLARQIHVDLRADQLNALGLSPDAVLAALRNENRNIPAGPYNQGNMEVLLRTRGEFASLEEIGNTVVTVRKGTSIRISDVADVKDSWEEVRQIIRIDGKATVRIAVTKQSGMNTVKVADAVKAEITRIHRDIPQVQLVALMDTSKYIRQSINNVGNSLILGGILAILVLFLFLRNVSSTAIIATAIPISLLATFGLIYFAGFTLNIMTLGGLALGIGMLVDGAIVVLENIFRHREQGEPPVESALVGTGEVASAVTASVLTTVVVFFPVVFVRGISGIMFQQMAYVVTFSLLCSLVVALTLVPMLASRFLRYGTAGGAGVTPSAAAGSAGTAGPSAGRSARRWLHRVYDASGRTFERIASRYSAMLDWALGHRKTVIVGTLILFGTSILLVRLIGVELMPSADEGEVDIDLEMAVGTRLDVVDQATHTVEDVVRSRVPEITSMLTRVGGGGWRSGGGHTANVELSLVSRSERKRSSEEIANALRQPLSNIPGLTVRTRASGGLFMMRLGQTSGDNVEVEVRGYDLETAKNLAARIAEAVRDVPGITDTRISRQEGSPEQIIRVDRQKAAALGLTVSRIGDALETAVGGTQASYYRESGKEYAIFVRLREDDRRDLADLLNLTVINSGGEPVALRNVVSTTSQEGPVRLERKDQERIITVSANFTGRDMGSVVSDIRERLRSVPVPQDFSIVFGGDYEEQQKAFRELLFGFIVAVVLVYLVMAGQFESFRDPFVVLFSIPMATIGVALTMILTGTIFSMQAFIGCIMLAGIVVNNAIVMVDYTNRLRRQHGMELMEAIKLGGARRLRPILMTTSTTVLGLLPLSLGLGEGGEAQAPLARVVIGGLVSSSLITLVLIPVIYSIFEQRLRGRTNP